LAVLRRVANRPGDGRSSFNPLVFRPDHDGTLPTESRGTTGARRQATNAAPMEAIMSVTELLLMLSLDNYSMVPCQD
jgi:hypothetical protein